MKLYAGNLPPELHSGALARLFGRYGPVQEAEVVLDAKTRRSRGFAFVTLLADHQARKAIKDLHGRLLGGHDLVVREAHPKESATSVYRSLH